MTTRLPDKCELCGKKFTKRRIFYGEDSCWYFAYHHPMKTCYVRVPTMMEMCLDWRLRNKGRIFEEAAVFGIERYALCDGLQKIVDYIDDQLQKSGFWLQDKEPKEGEE